MPITPNRAEPFFRLLKNLPSSSNSIPYKPPITVSSLRPCLYALVIGINFYDNATSLRGSVPDALAFKDYLETCLNVPADHIIFLRNKEASRSSILAGFARLRDDPRIEKGDPIVIFYAGHGSEVSSDSEEGKLQVLVPQDYSDDPEKPVPPIPDRTIGALLAQIAESKGNNITVIFDCCHSASGTRGQSTIVRSVELGPKPMKFDADRDSIWTSNRSFQPASGFLNHGLSSHILIAACSSSEKARESDGHGSFSSALLKLLRTTSPHELRYSDLLSHMDQIPGQNPQCEGVHRNRYIFDGKVVAKDRLCFSISILRDEYILAAGIIHGITKGAEFTLYTSTDLAFSTSLGELTVETLDAFSSHMKPKTPFILSPTTTSSVIAVQTKAGEPEDIRFYCPTSDEFTVCYQAFISVMQTSGTTSYQTTIRVDTPDDAHIEIARENDKFIFLYRDRRITQYGLNRIFYDIGTTVEELVPVIKAAAHYFWMLNRTNNNPEITDNIQVEIYKLHESPSNIDELGQPTLMPIGPNMCQDNVLDFVIDNDAIYGIKLVNNSTHDLYPSVFYFDNSDFDIGPYYEPPTTGKNYMLDVPLKKNGGILTIGYGTGGVPPFSYFLRDKQDYDVGFIKMFLSTQPVDLSSVSQSTPFQGRRSEADEKPKTRADMWGTILIPAIQRRHDPAKPKEQATCPQCGSALPEDLDFEQLRIENETLRQEIELHRLNTSKEIRRLENECKELRSKVEQQKAELVELANIQSSNELEELKGSRNLNAKDNKKSKPQSKVSLSERVKRLLLKSHV